MENSTAPASVAVAPVAAAPMPAAPVAPVQPAPAPGYVMDSGGGVPGSASIVKKPGFFAGITLQETLITGLVVFGLLYNIYYIRQKSLYLSYLKQTGASAPPPPASSSSSSSSSTS